MRSLLRPIIIVVLAGGFAIHPATARQHPSMPGARGILIEARNLAYDANYRNDQAGLKAAIDALKPLAGAKDIGAYANYYLAWTYWSLAGSQFYAKEMTAALESGKLAAEHARAGVAVRPQDPEFQAMLANALIVVMILDKAQFEKVFAEVQTLRRTSLELGPRNPRAIMLDASIAFNNPAEKGQERALARWLEALALLDSEAAEPQVDSIAPRWGHALGYGWLAGMYLRMAPPRTADARAAAEIALRMRPDFWFVREQVLPQLRE